MTRTGSSVTAEALRAAWEHGRAGWERGDVSGFDEIYSDDLVYHVPPFPDLDKAGLREFVTAFHQTFPDFHVEQDEEVLTGDTSVHRWHCEATFTGQASLLPVPPTGRRTTASGALWFHWTDGKVSEVWHFGDWFGWLSQAGVIPPLSA